MPLPVKLSEVIDGLEMADDNFKSYINRNTGEVASVSDEEAGWVEEEEEPGEDWPDWQVQALADARRILDSDEFIRLPTKFDIHEWSIMERFARSLDNKDDSDHLLDAIHGRGAFRMFKSIIARMGLREAWFKFRYDALAEIAIEFLEEHGIPYTRDRGRHA